MVRSNIMMKTLPTALSIAALAIMAWAPTVQAGEATSRQTAVLSPQAQATIAELLNANEHASADQLYSAIAPSLFDDPRLARAVVEFAQANPHEILRLMEALARIQFVLSSADPEKAKIIEDILKSAPPALQTAYAGILEAKNSDAEDAVKGVDTESMIRARRSYYVPVETGGSAGFGGGLVSPN